MLLRSKKSVVHTTKLVKKNKKRATKSPAKLPASFDNLIEQINTLSNSLTNANQKSFNKSDDHIRLHLSYDNIDENQSTQHMETNQEPSFNNDSFQFSPKVFSSQELKKNDNKTNKRNFKLLKTFDNLKEMDDYIRTYNEFSLKTTHNSNVNCTHCGKCSSFNKHKMSQIYMKCTCGMKTCSLAYKINHCEKNDFFILSECGAHIEPDEFEESSINVRTSKQRPKKRFGIAIRIQQILQKWLKKDCSRTAKKLLIDLIIRRKENLKKPIDEQNEKYSFSKNLLPSLKQVIFFTLT